MYSPHCDVLIVGAGFAGSVMARELAEAGKRVLVVDKRPHIGGNAFDYVNEHGVRIHEYGPHIFHTNSDAVFEYLSRFTDWRPYEHRVLSAVGDRLLPFPINLDTINQLFGLNLDAEGMRAFIDDEVRASWPDTGREIRTAKDQCLATVGQRLYETFFEGYTRKMWGLDASELDKSVTARIPLRLNRDGRYFTDKHQAMPKEGYTALFANLLGHKNIEIKLGVLAHGGSDGSMPLIWTGPIDEYFGHKIGQLPYRSMRFDYSEGPFNGTIEAPTIATINFPSERHPFTRATEWRALGGEPRTSFAHVTREQPTAEGDPFYPIPSPASRALYKRYEAMARAERNVTFLGRLGTYQYLNMDQAVGQALTCARRLMNR